MADVGTAVIRIIGDSSSFDRTLSTLGGKTAGALERGTRSLNDRAGLIGERFGASFSRVAGRAIRIGLASVAAGVAAAIGVTIVKGFKRFTTIEDATASLTLQLGSAEEAAGLLKAVLKVVEGTPFALDQFVDAARNLVAAGIGLEKVPGILEAVGDAAAAAGGSAEDVDSVVNSLGRMATGAELTLGPIRELEDKGVPALRILANKAGISTKEMAKRITAGTVDSKKAIDDLVDGIKNGTEGINGATVAFGGSAKLIGEQVSGAFANMQTAIARAGAKIIAVFAKSGKSGDGIVRVLDSVRKTVDVLGDAAVRMAKKFVGSDGFGGVLKFFDELPGKVEKATATLGEKGGFRKALLKLFDVGSFSELTKKLLDGLRETFEKIPAEQLGGMLTVVIVRGIESLSGFVPVIVAAMVKVAPTIIFGIGKGLVQAALDNPLNFALFAGALGVPGVAPLLAGLFSKLPFGFIIAPLISGLGRALQAGIGLIFGKALLAKIGIEFGLLGTRIGLLFLRIGPIVASALAAATPAIVVAIGVLAGILLHNLVEMFLPGVNRWLEDMGGAIFTFFADTLPRFFTQTIPRVISGVLKFFKELPGKIIDALAALGGMLLRTAGGWLASVMDALNRNVHRVIDFFQGLPGRIIGAFGNLGGLLYDVGRDIILGLINGIWSMARRLANSILNFIKRFIPKPFRDALGMESPSKVFAGFGGDIVQGLIDGIEGAAPSLHATMKRLAPSLNIPNVRLSGSVAGGDGGSAGGPLVQNFNVTVANTDPEVVARAMAFQAARAARR